MIDELVDGMSGRRVLVLGDVTLDKFCEGKVTKISPEAPVPQVEVESESYSLGGAANAINNLHSLDADVMITTVVGDDPEGGHLIRKIGKRGIDTDGIFRDEERITALVSRVRAEGYQMLRLERSKDVEIGSELSNQIIDHVSDVADSLDAIVISDYGRGTVTRPLIGHVAEVAKDSGLKVVVDPKRENFWQYEGVDVIRTNRREASYATGISSINETSIQNMGQKILNSLKCDATIITWIEEGFHIFEQSRETSFIPPLIDRPVDATGIGDTITCALALALASGASLRDASEVANYAGAIAATKEGLATITLEDLEKAIEESSIR